MGIQRVRDLLDRIKVKVQCYPDLVELCDQAIAATYRTRPRLGRRANAKRPRHLDTEPPSRSVGGTHRVR
jgi:hypothetical protein